MMKFQHRSLVRWLATGTILVGEANLGLFYFSKDLRTAIVAAVCIVLGAAYLVVLGIQKSRA